jgi:TetR/AcrR family transcriptional repressor of nem operon
MARGIHRDRLIEQGMALLSRNGYAATGVGEITAACGVPKGSFYNYFASKDDFAFAVIERYGRELCGFMAAGLAGEGDHLARLRRFFQTVIDHMVHEEFAGGCLAGRLAQELAGEQPQFRQPLERVFAAQRRLLAAHIAAGQTAGEIAAGLDPEQTAEFLQAAMQGAALRAKATGNDEPLRIFLQITFERLLAPGGAPSSNGPTATSLSAAASRDVPTP